MFDLSHGILFFFLSTTSIISILVVVLFLTNKVKKIEEKLIPTEAMKYHVYHYGYSTAQSYILLNYMHLLQTINQIVSLTSTTVLHPQTLFSTVIPTAFSTIATGSYKRTDSSESLYSPSSKHHGDFMAWNNPILPLISCNFLPFDIICPHTSTAQFLEPPTIQ